MQTIFSIRLKQRRREMELTMVELGNACGLTHGCISQYEAGFREPTTDTLLKFSSILKVTVDYLLGRSEYGIKDLLLDDRMYELLEGFRDLSYRNRYALYMFFEACVGKDKKAKRLMTEHGIPEQIRYNISGNGSLI